MSTEISTMLDISGLGTPFETGTICGHVDLEKSHGTSKCFTIMPRDGFESQMIVMPKHQALIVAAQIAEQFGYEIRKK